MNVVSIRTPALRDRREDIPILAKHFVERFRASSQRFVRVLSAEAEAMLAHYHWPGNVRELQNVIESAVVLGSTDMVLPKDLPADLFETGWAGSPLPKYQQVVNATKRKLVEEACLLEIVQQSIYGLQKTPTSLTLQTAAR